MEVVYRKSELKNLIAESSNEFKAKLGDGVESKNKEINGKAYSDAKKRAKDFDGGLQRKEEDWARGDAKFEKNDFNKTMLDVEPENADAEYQKRVKNLVVNDDDENKKIYQALKKSAKDIKDAEMGENLKGLAGRTRDKKYFERGSAYTNESIDVAKFKKTTFLSEEHMMSKIPDDFKIGGKVFKMKDSTSNEYVLEWNSADNRAVILEHHNPQGANDALSRMKELMGYETKDTSTSHCARINENDEKFAETLNKMRKIIK